MSHVVHGQTMRRLVSAVGFGDALRVCRKWGGRELDFPKSDAGRDFLALTLGFDVATKLVREFGGQRLRIPAEHSALLQARNAAIWKARQEGTSMEKIAHMFGLTRPGVGEILAKLKDRPDLQVSVDLGLAVTSGGAGAVPSVQHHAV